MKIRTMVVALAAALLVAGCGDADPGALGPVGVDGGLSPEGQRQQYVQGVGDALAQLGAAMGPSFSQAVDGGNRRQLQAASLAWQQGSQQLQSIDPPEAAVADHLALVKAVKALDAWNKRIVAAAPNKTATKRLATQASRSPASAQFGTAICKLVEDGFSVTDESACGAYADAAAAGPG